MNIYGKAILGLACTWMVGGAGGPAAAGEISVDLNGAWYFALDPLHRGEQTGWHRPPADWDRAKPLTPHGWDEVVVPHCWSIDPRYADIGCVWYRRAFAVPPQDAARVYRLQFGAVFYACRVWINGALAGAHEGGYVPFELDITPWVEPGAANFIAVEVDNSWDVHTLPGARPGDDPNLQLYPWWNYGGLLRDVRIVGHDPVYIAHQKVEYALASTGDAQLTIVARVCNRGNAPRRVRLAAEIASPSTGDIVGQARATDTIELAAGEERPVALHAEIAARHVVHWSVDHPHCYTSSVTVLAVPEAGAELHRRTDTFGIRTLAVRDAQFLLNGEPVRLAGANRVLDHPQHGGLEPDELIALDMGMMKAAHLEFARLQHYPCSPALLDWADRNGFLIIAEAASWGFPPEHLADPMVRDKFRAQLQAMIEQQWNHPCIVGWSVGNEYVSWVPEGVNWTKDMKAFVRTLDDTRPVVFVGLGGVMKHDELPREQRSLHYSDILCINCYMGEDEMATLLDRVHAVWPDKPILITEYGKRADRVDNEQQRVAHFHKVLALVRARPFICGLSYWTFNDYRSRYPGTNPSGYRPWGIVDPQRQPRALYAAMRSDLAPATLDARRAGGSVEVRVTVGAEFSAYALRGYRLRLLGPEDRILAETALPDLAPGTTHTGELAFSNTAADAIPVTVALVRPTGFIAATATVTAD